MLINEEAEGAWLIVEEIPAPIVVGIAAGERIAPVVACRDQEDPASCGKPLFHRGIPGFRHEDFARGGLHDGRRINPQGPAVLGAIEAWLAVAPSSGAGAGFHPQLQPGRRRGSGERHLHTAERMHLALRQPGGGERAAGHH